MMEPPGIILLQSSQTTRSVTLERFVCLVLLLYLPVKISPFFYVKKIFETYLRFGSGKETAKFLDLCGFKTPVKVSRKGIPHGGDEFTGMYIYRVLQNPLYLGLTKH